ncbi:hypothetical protein ACFL9T_16425 [Thermodesulfobacteriota bacterium]
MAYMKRESVDVKNAVYFFRIIAVCTKALREKSSIPARDRKKLFNVEK